MKYLILFLSFNLFAANWMTPSDLDNCRNGLSNRKHNRKILPIMYDVTGKDCETHTIQDVQVDDTDKPIYDKQKAIVCSGIIECQKQLQSVCETLIPDGESVGVEICVGYCEAHPKYSPIINKDYTETYCASNAPIGYIQKIIKRLKLDTTLQAAKDAALKIITYKREARLTDINEIRGYLNTITDSNLPVWHKKILKRLIRELRN